MVSLLKYMTGFKNSTSRNLDFFAFFAKNDENGGRGFESR